MTVLLLASEQDAHAKSVANKLKQLQVEFQFFSLKNLLCQSKFAMSINDHDFAAAIDFANSHIDFCQVQSIWLRNPGKVAVTPMPESWMEDFSQWESSRAIDSLWRLLPCFWVNHPAAQAEATAKIKQLEVARSCGFSIPDTIITNNAESAREFFQKHDRQIVYKLIDGDSWSFLPELELPRSIPTLTVRTEDLQYFQQIQMSLHLFQERLKKTHDIRVTVIGKKIFACQITSKDSNSNTVDWRVQPEPTFRSIELPSDLKNACAKLMDKLNLAYGAIDLCLNENGDFIFLEINPTGQFLWLEERLGLPLSLELAKLLAEGN